MVAIVWFLVGNPILPTGWFEIQPMPKSQFTPAYATFVKALIAARKDAGVAQLAERLGKPQPFISSIERASDAWTQ